MPTALIVGASRGLGHELARQYRRDGWRVIATARRQPDCAALGALGIEAHELDITNVDSIAALGWRLDDEKIDCAWLVAGLYGPAHAGFPTGAEFDAVMHTNVLGAMRVIPIIAPLLASSHGKLAVISSRMGSIGERRSTEASLYRASKAALNSVLKDASILHAGHITCVAMHPGWVQTDMGGQQATLTPEQSVSALRATLATLDPQANGQFLNLDGAPIAW